MGLVQSLFGVINEETPRYEVVPSIAASASGYEIRKYAATIHAEVRLSDFGGAQQDFQRNAFGLLAKYIGVFTRPQNQAVKANAVDAEPIAMTAPVVMSDSPVAAPEAIAMTAPVTMSQSGDRTMSFILPSSKYTISTEAPVPTDPRVHLRDEPARTLAVRQFSGTGYFRRGSDEQHPQKLLVQVDALWDALHRPDAGLRVISEKNQFLLMGYNPPWTLPWCTTVEVAFEVEIEQGEQEPEMRPWD